MYESTVNSCIVKIRHLMFFLFLFFSAAAHPQSKDEMTRSRRGYDQ